MFQRSGYFDLVNGTAQHAVYADIVTFMIRYRELERTLIWVWGYIDSIAENIIIFFIGCLPSKRFYIATVLSL